MTQPLSIVLAQLNLQVGDINGNLQKHIKAALTARDELNADLIVFPELSLVGYPAEDLLLRQSFINAATEALREFSSAVTDIYCVIGHPARTEKHLYNAASFIYNGNILGQYAKQHLPNYGVFDEYRYFTPGHTTCVVPVKGIPVGLVICEDLWFPGPVKRSVQEGAKLIVAPNASPFETDKYKRRLEVLAKRAQQNAVSIVYVNTVGGQDELIFDGGSMVINSDGSTGQLTGFFTETLAQAKIDITSMPSALSPTLPNEIETIYQALVLSLRDYVEKNRFKNVVLGLSGGIDSALTAAIAVDALGKARVQAVMMPSRFTSQMSIEDAERLAQNLGIKTETISIEPAYQTFLDSLAASFAGKKPDVTEENLQARCRAVILMALSNKYGSLVLTTGNRSELAVGYCTLYGDMAGGFGVLKDIPKTMVYQLADYRNTQQPVIPQRIIDRPPTAELALGQKDEDSLPPYAVLDKILALYLNQGLSAEEIIQSSAELDEATVAKVISLVRKNEYKRRQAAIGARINHQSFGKDWRFPITNGFKG